MRDDNRWLPRSELAAHAAAGALAGLTADAVVHPIDTLKARLHAARRSPLSVYRSLPAAVSHIARRRSALKSLYAGIGPVLVGSAPTHGIIFAVYKTLQARWGMTANGGVDPAVVDFLSGAIAETAALVAYVPSEVIAKRMQASAVFNSQTASSIGPPNVLSNAAGHQNGAINMLCAIYRTSGVRGLYTGAVPTMLRDVPFTALQLGLFEGMKMIYLRPSARGASPPAAMASWEAGLFGFAAGGIAAAVTNPIDVLKTRIQIGDVERPKAVTHGDTTSSTAVRSQRGLLWCAKKMAAEEGWRGMFRGMGARVAWVAPASAITLAVYESASAGIIAYTTRS